MSRAFVKENDGEETVARPSRQHLGDEPNYVTPAGADGLRARVAELGALRDRLAEEPDRVGRKSELRTVEDDLRYYRERLDRCIVVEPPEPPYERVGVGATVTVVDEFDEHHRFTIVGEDEADAGEGIISWSSPLGRALLSRYVGDSVSWKRPIGDMELEVLEIDYVNHVQSAG